MADVRLGQWRAFVWLPAVSVVWPEWSWRPRRGVWPPQPSPIPPMLRYWALGPFEVRRTLPPPPP